MLSNFSMSVLTPADMGISSSPAAKLLDNLGSAGKGREGAGGILSCPGLRWTGLGGTNKREGKKWEGKSPSSSSYTWNNIQVLSAERKVSALSPSFKNCTGVVLKDFLHQRKLLDARERPWAPAWCLYSSIRHVNGLSGWQSFTASLLPNRMRSSHFVFANVLTISITLTSFPSHDFTKLKTLC